MLTTTPAWSAFCDLCLALYPTTILWKLQMAFRLKLGLCILMGVGLMFVITLHRVFIPW